MNYSILSKAFIFAVGAAIGSAVTWKLVKTKYEKIADEEIESVKEVYSKKAYNEVKADADEYSELINKNGYSGDIPENKEEGDDDMKKPYVISPDDFGETGYEQVTLFYYNDKVLADDADNEIDDIDALVGEESLNHFGEYEEDSVYVRNDEMKTDYEILISERDYHGDIDQRLKRGDN